MLTYSGWSDWSAKGVCCLIAVLYKKVKYMLTYSGSLDLSAKRFCCLLSLL